MKMITHFLLGEKWLQNFTYPRIRSNKVDVSAWGASGSRAKFLDLQSGVSKQILVSSRKVQGFTEESKNYCHIKGVR